MTEKIRSRSSCILHLLHPVPGLRWLGACAIGRFIVCEPPGRPAETSYGASS